MVSIRTSIFCFLVIMGAFLAMPTNAFSATIYANSATGNDSTGDGSSGSPYATFHKAYTSASAGDTINLNGTFNWANAGETGDAQYTGYTISKNLTITGQAADETFIQAAGDSTSADRKVFTIDGATVTITDVTIRYGRNTTNYSGRSGGGIYVLSDATLTVEDCRITDNYVTSTSWGGFGGGIQNEGSLTVNRCTIDNNFAYSQGGGINNAYLADGSNTTTITNSTIAFNSTSATVATVGGAGIYIRSGTVYVTNTTIAYNDAPSGTGDTTGIDIVSGSTLHIKNSIVADNEVGGADVSGSSGNWFDITNSGTLNDNGGNIFGKVNTAYNGVSFHSTSWYDLYGNGAGDETYRLSSDAGTTGSLYLSTTLADNSTNNNTQTFAITNASSVAINNGQSGTNGSVSIPGVDQRGFYRNGSTDIGSYEYNGSSSDSTAPSVSLTAPSSGATVSGASVTLSASASDNDSVAGVSFYVNGVLQGSEDTTSSYAISWNSTATSSGSHTAFAVARDASNNYATSTSVSFTVDNDSPSISSVATSTTSTTATITWTTDEAASTKVNFGLTSSFGTSTPETDTSTRVTSHSATISSLKSCARYYYEVYSEDAIGNSATSTVDTFRTSGCSGGSTVSATSDGSITTASGGTLTRGNLSLTVPTSFTSTSSSAVFQAHEIDASTFFASVGNPSGKSRAGSSGVFTLIALTDATTTLASFESPLTVTLSYSDSDVSGLDESSLTIYRYDGSSWSELSSCSVDTAANTVTCTTTAFSDFSIFGDEASSSSSSSSSVSGGALPWCSGPMAPGWNVSLPGGGCSGVVAIVGATDDPVVTPIALETDAVIQTTTEPSAVSISEETAIPHTSPVSIFTRTLRAGMEGEDVRALQKFLNERGFILAPVGVGSLGFETSYFGPMTWNALVKFQEAHATDILAPWGLTQGSGIFGETTRAFIEANY